MANYIGAASNNDLDKAGTAIGGGVAGTLTKPEITYNAGTLTVGEGTYRFNKEAGFKGDLVEYMIPESTLVLAEDTPSFLVADYNNGNPIMSLATGLSTIDWGLHVPENIVYAENGIFSLIDGDETGNGLANKLQSFFFETQSYTRAYGLDLSEVGTRLINISAGKVFLAGSVAIPRSEVQSDNGEAYLRINNGDGSFTRTAFSSYPNTQYDDKSGTLQTLTDGNYGVVWVWRCMSTDCERMHIALGNGDYDLNEAKASQPPEHPNALDTNAMLLGRIIILKGASTATQIDSVFDTQFSPSVTTTHGGLTGLTGGHGGAYDKYKKNNRYHQCISRQKTGAWI